MRFFSTKVINYQNSFYDSFASQRKPLPGGLDSTSSLPSTPEFDCLVFTFIDRSSFLLCFNATHSQLVAPSLFSGLRFSFGIPEVNIAETVMKLPIKVEKPHHVL